MRGRLAARGARRVACWICAALALACTDPEQRLARHLERGGAYLEQGEVRAAVLEFHSALALRPDDPALLEQLGSALYRAERYEEALPYFEQSYEIDRSRPIAALRLARLRARSDPERARGIVEEQLAIDAESALVQHTLAFVLMVEGELDAAQSAAERAVALDPGDTDAWIQLGSIHEARIRRQGPRGAQVPEAIHTAAYEAYQKADEIRGGWSRAQIAMARVLGAWPGRERQARKAFLRALKTARATGSALEIGIAAWAIDEYGAETRNSKLRRSALRAIVEIDEDNYDAWEKLGRLVDGQRGHSGEEIYSELLSRRGDDPQAHLLYAGYLSRTRGKPAAEAHVRAAIEQGVDAPRLQEWLLRSRIQAEQYAEAREILETLRSEFPDERITRIAEARLDLAEGRWQQSSERLRTLIAEESSPELLRLLALSEFRQRHLLEARELIERAHLSTPGAPSFPIVRLRAHIAHDSGNWQETIDSSRILVGRGQKLSTDERARLATALHQMGRRKDALEIFEKLLASDPIPRNAILAHARAEARREPQRCRHLLLTAWRALPDDYELLELLSQIEAANGQREAALQRLDRMLAEGRATPRMLLLRAQLLAAGGEWSRAEADVLRALEAEPKLAGAGDLLYAIYRAQNRLDEARRSFEAAESAGVLHPGTRRLLGLVLFEAGELERARTLFDQVVKEMPEAWEAKNDLARVLAELGRELPRALQLARSAHAASGGNAETADTLAQVQLRLGKFASAHRYLRKALKRTKVEGGESPPLYDYRLGLALVGLGLEDEARAAFERSLRGGEFRGSDDARKQLEALHHRPASGDGNS